MRCVSREVLSTTRPSALRLAGFTCVAAGAVAAGIGATREWASIGFPADVLGAADVSVRGTDIWEGKVILLGAAAALTAVLAMRLAASRATRRGLAVLILVIGIVSTVLPALAALRPEGRFGGDSGEDRYVEWLAAESGLPEDVVRDTFREQFELALRVEVGPGVWLTTAGGLLLVLGGALGLRWVRDERRSRSSGGSATAA
jgi:hypothetical protein